MNVEQRIFISYHRSDSEIARRVRNHLASQGASTWMDEVDIPVGAYWPDEIDKGLAASDTIIGILSAASVESRNVKNEWDWAIQNRKRLVLLQIESCVIPHRYVSINLIDATAQEMPAAIGLVARAAGIEPPPSTPGALPETRYARSGDISIAFQIVSDGPIDLVLVPGYISHIDHMWNEPGWVEFQRGIASTSRLIVFDKRGTGLSDRTMDIPTIEQRMEDIRTVMDAAGSERAVVLGFSEGAPLACLFAATYPERAKALIVYGGYASEVAFTDYPWAPDRKARLAEIEHREQTLHKRWGTQEYAEELVEFFAPSRITDGKLVSWFSMLLRLGGSPGANTALNRTNMDIDIRHVLPTVRVPTLVVHRTGDRACKIEEGRYVANKIPNATFVELQGDDHYPGAGDIDALVDVIATFLRDIDQQASVENEIETILATIMAVQWNPAPLDIGTQSPSDLARQLLAKFRGVEIGESENGILARFDGPARAIRCACEIQQNLASRNLRVQIGLHTGEILLGPELASSLPVQIARELCAKEELGDVVVSSTVKDLVAGSGITFDQHGSHVIDRTTDQLRVFSVILEDQ